MVRRFNAALEALCAAHECLSFVDIEGELVEEGAGEMRRVRDEFVDRVDPTNVQCVSLSLSPSLSLSLSTLALALKAEAHLVLARSLLWEPTIHLWVRALAPLAHLAGSLDAARLGRSAEEHEKEKRERVGRREGSGSGAGG